MKIATGIRGLDDVLGGGLPAGRPALLIGGPGTGKTVFGLQFLSADSATRSEPGLMVSFEESPADLLANTSGFSWFPESEADRPAFIDGRMPEDSATNGTFDLGGLLAILKAHVARHGTKRIVLDGLDELFESGQRTAHARDEIRRLLQWLATIDATAIVSMKPGAGTEAVASDFEYAEYVAKTVIRLDYRSLGRLVQRTLRVIKMRGSNFAGGDHAYVISQNGIEIAFASTRKNVSRPSAERFSTGVERLDHMMGGGLRAGTVTLISGLPGTAKTTLGGAFLEAGLAAGHRALMIGFDEPAAQMLFDLESVGIRLTPYHERGLLRTATFNASAAIADEHFIAIERLVNEHAPKLLVIDPISSLEKAGGREISDLICERIVDLVKSRGIASLFTAVSTAASGDIEKTNTQVSTVCDTWVHLSYVVQMGERNRTLTIVKSRGTEHSNQMREMELGIGGISLKDVYYAEGGVLLGTARVERENRDERERVSRGYEQREELLRFEQQRTYAEAKIREGQDLLADVSARAQAAAERIAAQRRSDEAQREARLESRGADHRESSSGDMP